MRLRVTVALAVLVVLAIATVAWTRTDDCGDVPEEGGWFAYAPNTGVILEGCVIPPGEVEKLFGEHSGPDG